MKWQRFQKTWPLALMLLAAITVVAINAERAVRADGAGQ